MTERAIRAAAKRIASRVLMGGLRVDLDALADEIAALALEARGADPLDRAVAASFVRRDA